ncbi:hypothetical protein [Streptomyces sp. TE4109]
MPKPMDPKYTQGETEWSGPGFVRWLAADYPDLAHLTPHLLRPAGRVEAGYIGGLYGKNEPELREEHFAGHWRTGYGRLAVVYPRHHAFSPRRALEHLSQADTVVMVHADWSIYGLPNLVAVDRTRPELEYQPRWSEVAAHVGAPVPWWPADLRRREHLTTWSPGKKPQAVEVVTWPSWEPLYDMALREAKGTPVRVACFSLGHEMRRRAVEHVDWEIGQMNGDDESDSPAFAKRRAAQRDSMVIPAFPDRTDPGASEAEDDDSIRAGVAQLWRRTDELAVECLEQIALWSGEYMPFGGSFSVNTADATPAGREWVRRLQKSEPTAIHQVWESQNEVTGTFTDPVTSAPVVTKKGYYMFRPSDEVTFHSYAPRRLPAGSEIKEVILDNPIWVRVQDGTLYPAPTMDAPGLSWGYTGSGPGALATLIGRLLDDGAAHALTYGDKGDVLNGEPKLEKFLQLKHQTGTRLNRRLLENVRTNGPDKLSLLTRLRLGRPEPS